MDDIARRMAETRWTWADKDPKALAELERRLAATARRGKPITYSDLVAGVTFQLANLNCGRPYRIDVARWTDLDRALIGEFLGYVSTRSYCGHGFMASALVVEKEEQKPSSHFFQWMRKLGAIPSTAEDVTLSFWIGQLNRAYGHYGADPRR